MADEIIEELWAIKDEIAREADYDIDKLVDLLQERQEHREDRTSNNSGGNVARVDNAASPVQ